MKIYHNPRCSKSRETLDLIMKQGKDVEVIEYLKETPTREELGSLIKLLGIKPIDLIRQKEDDFKNYKNASLTDDEYIDLMVKFPKLIERPIVVEGNKAILGRPPQKVLELL